MSVDWAPYLWPHLSDGDVKWQSSVLVLYKGHFKKSEGLFDKSSSCSNQADFNWLKRLPVCAHKEKRENSSEFSFDKS